MASYKLFRCWWKDYSANNSVFYDLSDSCKFSDLNWSAKLSNEPIEFSFSLSIPEVSNNPVYPEAGDEILFTTDSSKYQVVSNALYGIITDPGKSIISYDPLNARINYTYNVTVQQKDFSGYEVINQTWNNAYVSDILDNIMDYTTDGFLGGVTDNSTFTKYKLIAPDILITNFVSQDLTAREAIEKLCNENNLYYKMQYSSYPASTVNLKVISQIFILNQSGQAPPDTSSWGLTLDNTNLFKGLILNPLYAVNSTLPQYVASESGFTYSEDRDIIRNYIQLEAFATDDDPGNITFNRIIAGSSFQDTYILPYQAKDIVYVGVYSNYESYIKGTSATTTTTFYVPSHVAAILAVGNVVRIEYNSEFYLRTVSNVDTGTDQITLSEAMPAGFARAANVQLVIGEALEVVGNVTIYEDNQDTDLTTGVVKNIQLNEKAQIRFLENSIPSQGQVIVTGYYEVKNYKQSQFNHESIEKYGLRRHKETIANPLTRSQITEIFNSLLIPNPNVTISFYSDRIDLIEIGHQININMENFYTGFLICTAVKMQTISGVNWNNQQHIRQYITLSTLVEDLADILKRITQSVKQYKPTGPENLKGQQSEKVSILDTFTFSKSEIIGTLHYIFTRDDVGRFIPKKYNAVSGVVSDLFTAAANTDYYYMSYNEIRNRLVYARTTSGTKYICTSDVNGTNETVLLTSNVADPAWSRNGNYIFYINESTKKVMRMDWNGSNITEITSTAAGIEYYDIRTSADSTKLSFYHYTNTDFRVKITTANQESPFNVTEIITDGYYYHSAWKPDGLKLAVSGRPTTDPQNSLFLFDTNGTNRQYVVGNGTLNQQFSQMAWIDNRYLLAIKYVSGSGHQSMYRVDMSSVDTIELLYPIPATQTNGNTIGDYPFIYL